MSSSDKDTLDKREKRALHMKTFYEKHPEKLIEKITCPECGGLYKYYYKTQHYESKKHKNIITAISYEKLKKQIKDIRDC
jgi:hypothetical protein